MIPPDDRINDEQLIGELQRSFTDALLRGDETLAEATLRDGIEAGVGEGIIDDDVIAPALRIVGDLWESGQLSIAEEHLATEIAIRSVALERELFRLARRRKRTVVLLAAVEGEQHVVGLRMAGSILVHAGYQVFQLGANVPTHALAVAVDRHAPDVVGLSVTMASGADRLLDAIGLVRVVHPQCGVVVGGRGVPPHVLDQPGLRRCERVSEAVALVDGLVQRAAMN